MEGLDVSEMANCDVTNNVSIYFGTGNSVNKSKLKKKTSEIYESSSIGWKVKTERRRRRRLLSI